MLNEKDTISRLQSSTVRQALILIIINALTLITVFTGHTFNIEAIKSNLEMWLPIAINAASTVGAWFVYKGRIKAEAKIEPLPWLDEVKSIKEKR